MLFTKLPHFCALLVNSNKQFTTMHIFVIATISTGNITLQTDFNDGIQPQPLPNYRTTNMQVGLVC